MDSKFLKSLILVIECGSIAKAARIEHLTAAAVSQRIKALEFEFGFELLNRVGHSATPTEACLGILPRARRIVHEVRLLAGDADSQGLTGTLRLGVISSAITPLFMSTLRKLGSSHPGIHINLVQNISRNLYGMLMSGELDGAILVTPMFELPKTLGAVVLREEPLVLITQNPTTKSIQSLIQSNGYIAYDPESFSGHLAQQYLEDRGVAVKPVFATDSLTAIAMLVADGVGVSLVPHWHSLETHYASCAVRPIEDSRYTRKLVLMTSKLTDRPGMIEKLLQVLAV